MVKSTAIEGFVKKVLIPNATTPLNSKQICIAVRVLLRAKPTKSLEMNKRRVIKDERKQKHRFMMAPHEFLHMVNQTENMCNLSSHCSSENLEEFLRHKANIYLVNYFDKNKDP